MPTNPIAADTTNLAVNILKEQNLFLGQIAHQEDKSKGELVKQLICDGLKLRDPELAQKWQQIKLSRFVESLALCFMGSLVIWQALLGNIDARRSPRPLRARKEQAA